MNLFRPQGQLRPLRGKQIPLIPAIADAVKQGHVRIMVQAPTGFGKTVVAAHLMHRSASKGKRPMFVCPAIQLVEQTLESFEAQGLNDIGVIQAAHHRTDWKAQIQIASRDTLVRRPLPEVDFAIIDEAHDQRDAMNAILDSEAWKRKVVVGLSATPWSRGLGLRWTKLIIASTMAEMIAEGPPSGLSRFVVYGTAVEPDMTGIKTVAGDFEDAGTARVMSAEKIVGDAVDTWMRHRQEQHHPGDRTFLYGVNRAHAKVLMEKFQASGIKFGYIDGSSTAEDRKRVFDRYRSREDKGICNVGVLITGVDEDVRCISDCAPTRSETRMVQRWGRGARLADGKEYCFGLDHAGNMERLGSPWDIHHGTLDMRGPKDDGEAYEDDKPAPKPRKCPQCHAMIPPATRACPTCGHVYEAPNRVEHHPGELIELRPKKAIELRPKKAKMDEKQAFYSGLLDFANRRGFKEGWAANKYRERFGVWPNQLEKIPRTPRKAVKEFIAESGRKWRESRKVEA